MQKVHSWVVSVGLVSILSGCANHQLPRTTETTSVGEISSQTNTTAVQVFKSMQAVHQRKAKAEQAQKQRQREQAITKAEQARRLLAIEQIEEARRKKAHAAKKALQKALFSKALQGELVLTSSTLELGRNCEPLGWVEVLLEKATVFQPMPTQYHAERALKDKAKQLGANLLMGVSYQIGTDLNTWNQLHAKGMAIKINP